MELKISEMIAQAGAEVFGTMYYIPIELMPEVPEQVTWNLDKSYIKAKIGFSGPLEASINFFFPDSLARNIAGGFLGLEVSEVSDQQTMDTMQEAANMMIGCYLGKVDPDGECTLAIPSAEIVEGFSPTDLESEGEVIVFESDFGFLWMTYA